MSNKDFSLIYKIAPESTEFADYLSELGTLWRQRETEEMAVIYAFNYGVAIGVHRERDRRKKKITAPDGNPKAVAGGVPI